MIYAVSPEGVIGANGGIPWRHPGDLRRFKRMTMGATVVMGRKTFQSIGKPLQGRRNIVVTSHILDAPGVECVASLKDALTRSGSENVWFVGGAAIYAEAMAYADVIDVTYVPDHVVGTDLVRAPLIDTDIFEPGPLVTHEEAPELTRRVYVRRTHA
jgi:dihydrofolate reductase